MKKILFFLFCLLSINSCNVMDLAGVVDGKISSDFLKNPNDKIVYFTVGDTLNFPNRLYTAAATSQSVTLYNNSGKEIEILDGVIESGVHFNFLGATFPGTNGTCNYGLILNHQSSCTVYIEAAAGSMGYYNGNLKVEYQYTSQSKSEFVSIKINESIVDTPAVLSFSNGSIYDYGYISSGNNAFHTFTITNSGEVSATSISETGLAAPYSRVGGTCGTTLAAGNSCTIIVSFSPATANVVHNDTINIQYDNGAEIVAATRDVTGTGTGI